MTSLSVMREKIICLFIDDDSDDQEIFRFAVHNLGLPVTFVPASDGVEALRILNEDKNFVPDLIFLDLNMPMMNGKECLSELRKIQRLSTVPIVIFTTSSNDNDLKETQKLGATDFITKQASLEQLKSLIGYIFKKYNLQLTN
jgi:CheY-like chemotaxis protein